MNVWNSVRPSSQKGISLATNRCEKGERSVREGSVREGCENDAGKFVGEGCEKVVIMMM